jgi:hypothetical protein
MVSLVSHNYTIVSASLHERPANTSIDHESLAETIRDQERPSRPCIRDRERLADTSLGLVLLYWCYNTKQQLKRNNLPTGYSDVTCHLLDIPIFKDLMIIMHTRPP